jgi:hypothetical protein
MQTLNWRIREILDLMYVIHKATENTGNYWTASDHDENISCFEGVALCPLGVGPIVMTIVCFEENLRSTSHRASELGVQWTMSEMFFALVCNLVHGPPRLRL